MLIDFIIKFYAILYSKKPIINKFLSPCRFLWRKLGNVLLPVLLKKKIRQGRSVTGGSRLIVSFTSFPARIGSVWQVVRCMLNQTLSPDKIVLWLSKEQFPSKQDIPDSLLQLEGDIFEIRLVEGDLRSHKKYCYAFKEFRDDLVFLIDDDLYYPSDTLEKVFAAHNKYPQAVVARYAYVIRHNQDGTVRPYIEWKKEEGASADPQLFFGSGGGTLFQPRLLYKDILNEDLFVRFTPQADDIWLNAMVRLAELSIVKLPYGLFMPVYNPENQTLASTNLYENRNDKQLADVISYYKDSKGVALFESKS